MAEQTESAGGWRERCADLERRLAEAEAERDIAARYVGNLAAAQADNARLREALSFAAYDMAERACAACLPTHEAILKALAQPSDTSALRAWATKTLLLFSDRCALYPEADRQHIIDDVLEEVLHRSGEASEGGGA